MGGDESAYGTEVADLVTWCQENKFSLSVNKTKAMIVDLRWRKEKHSALCIGGIAVAGVSSFRFLDVPIADDLNCSPNIKEFLKRLRKFGITGQILNSFYRFPIRSLLDATGVLKPEHQD